ncbi:hypothetical protein DM872_26545 [Pseudomonas taiwanensis]|uniref:nuclease-related domain-containing DEAD/DEAH box helicase n=1 Tax=Pseudomonas taiwanensis TaxID=470150 RepID=UPI0015BE7E55|nr:NERD domain-containing protein [Pseudomonas taiwanensis]NWL80415.1 hypothetical protein [Pseudomonas taiwanensis]
MDIFPRYQLRPRLKGEARVYDLLAKVPDRHGFAVHSVNLPEHEYKRWGEADFIIVSRSGVTLLEVKGGSVSLAGKVWRYENARGQAITSTEGPARQAMSAAVALEKLLAKHLDKKVRSRWGVVFPYCSFKKNVAELPTSRLANNLTCSELSSFQDWLINLPFDQHKPKDFALEDADIDRIREILVPELSAATSLGLVVRSTQEEAIRLTEQQFAILESLEVNSRLCISGGAGTGKTELVALCARAERAAGRTPAIVVSGTPLSAALRSRMSAFGIPVVSDSLPIGTDTLIVDEGQDFAQPDRMEMLFRQLPGGVSGGRWRWFMDPNLQFTSFAPDSECLKSLACNSAGVVLTRNVRSTREIVNSIRAFLDADVGISQIDGFGIKVGFHSVGNTDGELAAVRRLIEFMLEDGVRPSEMAVLGAGAELGPTCKKVLQQMRGLFRPLSLEGEIQSSVHGVVCGISAFRGLEARVVFLVDLHLLPTDQRGESLLYIGMSRASASLQLLVQPEFGAFLKALIRNSFERK